jgi:putative Holliday junction resolvase
LAISDATGTLATPLAVLARASRPALDHKAIVSTALEEAAERIVVGLPRSLSGDDGPAARLVRDEVEELRGVAGQDLPVDFYDERFSTVTATRRLREAGRRKGRDSVDAAAAAVILQSYLDGPGRSGDGA